MKTYAVRHSDSSAFGIGSSRPALLATAFAAAAVALVAFGTAGARADDRYVQGVFDAMRAPAGAHPAAIEAYYGQVAQTVPGSNLGERQPGSATLPYEPNLDETRTH
jgi:hypothetical protein